MSSELNGCANVIRALLIIVNIMFAVSQWHYCYYIIYIIIVEFLHGLERI